MSGVSTDNTPATPDLDALIAGGDAFLQRISELKAAKAEADASLAALGLGTDAKAALDKANQTLADAQQKRDADMAALQVEIQSAKDNLNSWIEQVKRDTRVSLDSALKANDQAQSLRDAAESDRAAAREELTSAGNSSSQTVQGAQAQATKIVADATAEAQRLTQSIAELKVSLAASLIGSQAAEAKFKSKLEAIQRATAAALTEDA